MSRSTPNGREVIAANARKILADQGLDVEVRLSTERTKSTVLWLFAVGRHVGTVFISETGSMATYRATRIVRTYAKGMTTQATLSDALRYAATNEAGQPHGVPA